MLAALEFQELQDLDHLLDQVRYPVVVVALHILEPVSVKWVVLVAAVVEAVLNQVARQCSEAHTAMQAATASAVAYTLAVGAGLGQLETTQPQPQYLELVVRDVPQVCKLIRVSLTQAAGVVGTLLEARVVVALVVTLL